MCHAAGACLAAECAGKVGVVEVEVLSLEHEVAAAGAGGAVGVGQEPCP